MQRSERPSNSPTESRKKQLSPDSLPHRHAHPTDPPPQYDNTTESTADTQIRALIRLLQCQVCSRPVKVPLTLPCGYSLCRDCLPAPHGRGNISYPRADGRSQAIWCPVQQCGLEHPLAECNIDVTLAKVLELIQMTAASLDLEDIAMEAMASIKERDAEPPQAGREPRLPRTLTGGRLLATFKLAELGELDYGANCIYDIQPESEHSCSAIDQLLLQTVSDDALKELDCQVCYNLLLDPVTTPCGHTFCRKCLSRVFDHSFYCPMCRRLLPMSAQLSNHPSNFRLVSLLLNFWPDLVAARIEAVAAEELGVGDFTVPIFVCVLAFPEMPTYLHIFEPRYRLMIRRAWESNRRFGMVAYNSLRAPQPELGRVDYLQFGTMLEILDVRVLPDGRSLIETRGLYPFKVKKTGVLDGYMVGDVERVNDIGTTEEEERERRDLANATDRNPPELRPEMDRHDSTLEEDSNDQPAAADLQESTQTQTAEPHSANQPQSTPAPQPTTLAVDSMTTEELYQAGRDFVEQMRAQSATWLHRRILDAYGDMPADPKLFPYWFASVLPMAEDEKYQLLYTRSVRDRLKITNRWIRQIQSRRIPADW